MPNNPSFARSESRYLSELKIPETFLCPQSTDSYLDAAELRQALVDAMASPINYPAISEAIFPGDAVAIAVQSNLPQVDNILRAIIPSLQEFDIVIVAGANSSKQLESSAIADLPSVNVKLVEHQASDENSMAMVGVNAKAEPVYLNRDLVEADVVIPIGFPSEDSEGQPLDCVYPFFSGVADQERFESANESQRPGLVRLANNLLGSFWSIQFVIGPGDNVHQVLIGETEHVIREAREAQEQVWQVDFESEYPLAIATIESQAVELTWQDFYSALLSADQVTQQGCPIVVCGEINSMPNKKIHQAMMMAFESRPNPDLKLTAELLRFSEIIRERTIYLWSGLSQSKTEELGLGFISDASELQRIVDKNPQGVLLRDAHRCKIKQIN